eukprot:GHVP01033834.1.p1 GENE.GHVP01033834.1~~GHVP01033834.1.p1  ORF type:complete len:269 (-),score=61.64 GHVP01033834.1:100-906(-)
MSFPDEPLAMKNGLEIDVMLRILPQMLQLEVCPFSFQRMAELVQMEDKTYKSVDRWLYAIQRGLNVTVPSDPSEVVKPENSDVEMLEKIMQGLSEKFRTLLSEREYEPSASILSEESNDEDVGSSDDRNRKRKIPSNDVSPEKKVESPKKPEFPVVDIVASAIADLVDESDFDTGMKIKKPRTEGRSSFEETTNTSTTSKFVNILEQAGVSIDMLIGGEEGSAKSKEEHVPHVYVHENEEEDSLFGGVLVSPAEEKEESASLLSESPE